MTQNIKILLKSSINWRRRIFIRKKYPKSIAKKTFGSSNPNPIIKEKESFCPATSKKSKAFWFQSQSTQDGTLVFIFRIVQKAIEKPLLYKGRKFDIRVWVLVTPQLEIYYYNTPYIRTSSSIYTTDVMTSEIHLTNNCQQKHFG